VAAMDGQGRGCRQRQMLGGSRCWWRREAWCNGAALILSFGVGSCSQGGGELRCIGRNHALALSVPTMA
jgi:hypothetical protein